MQTKLYIIEYEGAHWCGGLSHCLAYAVSEDDAVLEAEVYMDETMRELFSDEYRDDRDEGGNLDDDMAYTVNWVRELTPEDEYWEWVQDPRQQAAFYPYVNA